MRLKKSMLLTVPAALMLGYLSAVLIKRCAAPYYGPENVPSGYLDEEQLEDKVLGGNGSAGYPPPPSKTVWEKIANHYGLPWPLCR